MNKEEKKQQVALWEEKIANTKAAILTDFRGLDVSQMNELRNKLREKEVSYQVVKNTLLRKALGKLGQEELHKFLSGPTGVAYSDSDSIEPAKILKSFTKEHKKLTVKGGLVEGKVLNVEEIAVLADLPGKQQLIAMLLACFQFPLVGLMAVLQGNIRELLCVLTAIKEKKSA